MMSFQQVVLSQSKKKKNFQKLLSWMFAKLDFCRTETKKVDDEN